MLSSRNIHFAILGIILGATSGYIFAFYQVQKSMPPPAAAASTNSQPAHPNVTEEQLLDMFDEALQKAPNDPELLARYAVFLSDIGRRAEGEKVFKKLEQIAPGFEGLDAVRKRLAVERGKAQ